MGSSSGHSWEFDTVDSFVIADIQEFGCLGVFFGRDGWNLAKWLSLGINNVILNICIVGFLDQLFL